MANLFNSVKIKNRKRVPFNLSHSVRLTTEFGRLTPIMCEPVLPADKFKLSTVLSVQFAPLTFPVMEKFKAYVHYFFVANRLLMKDWEDFITGGVSGTAEYAYPVIKVTDEKMSASGGINQGDFEDSSLFDYLGFPSVSKNDTLMVGDDAKYFDALPFKAYQLIYNEWYRDQNLENALDIQPELNGVQNDESDEFAIELLTIRYRAWKKDYFTSALPDPQRGPDVTLPLLGTIGIEGDDENISVGLNRFDAYDSNNPPTHYTGSLHVHSSGGDEKFVATTPNVPNNAHVDITGDLPANDVAEHLELTSNQRSATINEVRKAFAVQRLYELAARVGGRYMENILGNFGVRAGDARLQRPEYLGGSVVPIIVGDVLQTSATQRNQTPLGMPAGVAGGSGQVKEFKHHFTEHGWIIGILSIMPEACYMQGIPRKFLKRDRFDFAWPLLANIGEQEIQSQELFFDFSGSDADNKAGFGYTPRYAEYKFGINSIHGDFRHNLADFHDARVFDSRPALNQEFVTVKPDSSNSGLNRIFSVVSNSYDHLWVHLYNDCKVLRKLPKYGNPI